MKKIISLFQRDWAGDRRARNVVTPGAEWVLAGEGVATVKWDGTCCMIQDGKFYKRYEHKVGRKIPENFIAATDVDPETKKQQGWVPVGDGPEDQYHREGFRALTSRTDGTYELVGPKVQGNAELMLTHCLWRHGSKILDDVPRTFEGLKQYLVDRDIEGIVWHHPDGRMVKIKAADFGIKRAS